MKYIFVAGAPGSKWSSVVKNIYFSPSIDRSDYSEDRLYYHDASGKMELMHLGAYFDPGMEFELPESLSSLSKHQAEELFDAPFNGSGVRIVKSHIFGYHENLEYLKEHWPECPVVLVHRSNDSCLGWWVKCGHFNITYPKYDQYYVDLKTMATIINKQNEGIEYAMNHYAGRKHMSTNEQLAASLKIKPVPAEYKQDYITSDIEVTVI
jgi:hypothetical protein